MPLYDYQCDQCGHRFEVRQGIKEDPLTECPQCQGAIRRVIHPVGIVFKGSGFYITDSRNKSSAATGLDSAKGDKGDKKESSSASESTSASAGAESKPAAAGSGKPASSTASSD